MWCGIEEMGTMIVPNIPGVSMAQRMTNVVVVDYVHGAVGSCKLWATWA